VYLIGLIFDVWVNITKYFKIEVSENYMDYVFSAVVTISVLSFTIVALIGNCLNDKYLGYEIKEILNFNNSPINIKKYIILSLTNVVIALITLTINFRINSVNILVASLISTIILTLDMGIRICKILTNDEYCKELVKEYYNSISECGSGVSLPRYQKCLDKLKGAFDIALETGNKQDKEFILKLIYQLNSKIVQNANYYNYLECLNNFITNIIVNSTLNVGYIETVKDVIKLYHSINGKYELISKILIPIEEIEYYEDKKLKQINYLNQIINLEWELRKTEECDLSNEDIRKIIYRYFECLMENKVCIISTKKFLVKKFIKEFTTSFGIITEEKITNNQYVLLIILKNYVLYNKKINEREFIYFELLKNIHINNFLAEDGYFETLSLMLQAFYSVIELEQKLLTKNFRNQIMELFQKNVDTMNFEGIKLSRIVKNNIENILKAIAKRIELSNDIGKVFEYFPKYMIVKSIIWTEEFNIEFFFMLYLVNNSDIYWYSPYGDFFEWTSISTNKKKQILNVFLSFFDCNTSKLSSDKLIRCNQMATLFEQEFYINEDKQKELFNHIMDEKSKVIKSSNQNIQVPICNIDSIMQEFINAMDRYKIYGWNSEFICETPIEVSIQERLCIKEYYNEKSAAMEIIHAVEKVINENIKKYGNILEITFDDNGINTIGEFLQSNKYDSRNYTFTNDWAFNNEVKKRKEFKNVMESEESLKFIETPRIKQKMYFNRHKFKFNVEITEYRLTKLTESECSEYLENLKSYNGKYNIDGTLLIKSEAMEIVMNKYCREKIKFKLFFNINKNDITYLKFIR
jgi:hypothetical protein